MKLAVVAHRRSATNEALAAAARSCGLVAEVLEPYRALALLEPGDIALARLDVREGLDGIESGTGELERLAVAGVEVLNPPGALVAAHDKLLTARVLRLAGLPHPHTTLLAPALPALAPELPIVLKPRFGSWGRDVELCTTAQELEEAFVRAQSSGWFRDHGVIAQELVEPRGWDLRVVVAGGRVVGAARRVALPGEWRTNASLGANVEPVDAPLLARTLALAAVQAVGSDLAGRRSPADAERLRRARGERRRRLPAALRARRRATSSRGLCWSSSPTAGAARRRREQARLARSGLVRLGLETGLDHAPAVALVDEVDCLVLAVRPRDPEPHRRPAPEAEPPFLRDRTREDERPALHFEVLAAALAHAADVHLERRRDVDRQFDPRALGHAP